MSTPPDIRQIHGRRPWLLPLLLVALAVLAHMWELSGEFVYDDAPYIQLNPALQSLSEWPRFFTDVSTYSVTATSHYRPLVTLSYAINHAMGASTVPFKVTQLTLHAVTVLALFFALSGLGRLTGRLDPEVAFGAAALFAILPFNVEAVHYMTARSAVMCGMFSMLALALYVRMRAARGGRAVAWYAVHLLALGAALISKETALTVPAALLVLDLLVLRPALNLRWDSPRLWAPYAPYAVGLVVALSVMPNVTWAFHYLARVTGEEWRLATAFWCLAENLRLMVIPTGLTLAHPIDTTVGLTSPQTVLSLLVIGLLAIAAWRVRRTMPLVPVGFAWYLLLIAPSTFVHLTTILLENRGYTASAGICIAGAVLFARLWEVARPRRRQLAAAAGVVAVLFLVVTGARQRVWAGNIPLWEDAVQHDPDSYDAWTNLAAFYVMAGRVEEGERIFYRLATTRTELDARYNLARVWVIQERFEEAERLLSRTIADAPGQPRYLVQLAEVYTRLNRPGQATDTLLQLLDAEIENERTRKYFHTGDPERTVTELVRQAIRAGRLDAARHGIRVLREHRPQAAVSDMLALHVAGASGDVEQARAALARLRERLPGDPRLPGWEAAVAGMESGNGGTP
ncbi:MAG: hypothetical protein OEY97_09140 [Nitrospirota bacterium]|nr:hypothetical protein [Nitrospirota bacterium]